MTPKNLKLKGWQHMNDAVDEAAAAEAAEAEAADEVVDDDPVRTQLLKYLALKAQIAELEADADEIKDEVCEGLDTALAPTGHRWAFVGVIVSKVKGRRTEKISKVKLAKAGVSAEVIDAATEVSESTPSVRITRAGDGEEG